MNNKGFSFIEFVIVMAIMAVVSGLSFMTFSAANRRQPGKTRDNFKNYLTYVSKLTQSEDKDLCVAIVEKNNECFAVLGVASGDSQATLLSSFETAKKQAATYNGKSTFIYVGDRPLSDITSGSMRPNEADYFLALGTKTKMGFTDGSVSGASRALIEPNAPVIVKFRKFDGSVVSGYGEFTFGARADIDTNSSVLVLEKTTGNIHLKK